jgi:hypothetical protein
MSSNKIGSLYTNIEDVRKNYLSNLSQTSQFKVSLLLGSSDPLPSDLRGHLSRCGLIGNKAEQYDFMCAEATLPGSTFDMGEEYGSRQGIIERFPNRRIYSDFTLTFYVDSEYDLIRLFEEWMNYIDPLYAPNGEYTGNDTSFGGRFLEPNAYYRFKYPDTYKKNIAITKFERDFLDNPNKVPTRSNRFNDQTTLTYYFVDAFPTNITALPLSYEGSTITKTSITFNYTRYTINKHKGTKLPQRTINPSNPDQPPQQSSNQNFRVVTEFSPYGSSLTFGEGGNAPELGDLT